LGKAETWTSYKKFNNEGKLEGNRKSEKKTENKILWLYGQVNTLEQCKICSL